MMIEMATPAGPTSEVAPGNQGLAQLASYLQVEVERLGQFFCRPRRVGCACSERSAFRAATPILHPGWTLTRALADVCQSDVRPEVELLFCCLRNRLDRGGTPRIQSLLQGRIDWAYLFNLAG